VLWLEEKAGVNEYRAQVGLPTLEENPLYQNPHGSVSKEEANKIQSKNHGLSQWGGGAKRTLMTV